MGTSYYIFNMYVNSLSLFLYEILYVISYGKIFALM